MQELFREFTREQFYDQNISVFHLEVVYQCLTSCSLNALIITDFVMEFYREVRARYEGEREGARRRGRSGEKLNTNIPITKHEPRLHQ